MWQKSGALVLMCVTASAAFTWPVEQEETSKGKVLSKCPWLQVARGEEPHNPYILKSKSMFPSYFTVCNVLLISVSAVHAKSLVAILHLLVALSQYFRAPIRLPDHVSIQVVVVQVREVLNNCWNCCEVDGGVSWKLHPEFLFGWARMCVSGWRETHVHLPCWQCFNRKRQECFPRLNCGSEYYILVVKWPDSDIKITWSIIIVGMCLSPKMISRIIIFPVFDGILTCVGIQIILGTEWGIVTVYYI